MTTIDITRSDPHAAQGQASLDHAPAEATGGVVRRPRPRPLVFRRLRARWLRWQKPRKRG